MGTAIYIAVVLVYSSVYMTSQLVMEINVTMQVYFVITGNQAKGAD